MDASLLTWVAFSAFVVAALAVDFLLFEPRRGGGATMRRAVVWSAVWLALALGFAALLWIGEGSRTGGQFATGYLLERALSLDNLFVFALIFGSFAVPDAHRQRVLELGIIGALVLRLAFILVGAELIELVDWTLYVFGAFILYTGVQMVRHRGTEKQFDAEGNPGVRLLRRVMAVTDDYRGGAFAVRERGRWMATPLLLVVGVVATTDVIFAVDSIPAIFGVTTNTFIVFAANAFALLGLRALFALLAHARDRFVHLELGLALVLVFIGAKMLAEAVVHVPVALSLGVIVLTLTAAVLASLRDGRAVVKPV